MVTGELFLSYKGPGSELEILDLVRTITAVPASMVLTAVVRGCHALELKRIVMASPFPEDQDERLVKFLAHYDIEVVAFRGLGCPNADVIWELPSASGYELAAALLNEYQDVDGIYMPCNKWRVVSVIERIEKGSWQAGGEQHPGVGLGGAAADEYGEARSGLRAAAERIRVIKPGGLSEAVE